MVRNIVCAVALLVMSFSLVVAETLTGTLKSVDGNKVTVNVKAKGEKKGEDKTFDTAASVKVYKMDKKNKVDLAGGLKAEELKAGAAVKIEVDGGKVTEIGVSGGKKK